jgi:hypothetical protein|tara:strand:- start:716 stop:922 length:207 start_codon:yes stop_codon:yes gene_type:complete
MVAPARIWASSIYLASIALCLVSALFSQPSLVVALIAVQFCSLAWYCLTYIPLGRGTIRRLIRCFCGC